MIANPIIRRELLGLLRRPQTPVLCALIIAVLSAIVLALWPDRANVSLDGAQSKLLFRVFVYGLLSCLLLAVPAFPATAIVRERNEGTLGLLLTSPLKPLDILAGKIAAALGFVGLVLALSLPALVACFVMGGIDLTQVAGAYLVLVLAAAQYALAGLVVSSYARRTDSALRVTYGLTLTLAVLVLGPFKLLQGRLFGLGNELLYTVYCISPIPALIELTGAGDVGSIGLQHAFEPGAVTRYAILATLSIVACMLWLAARLRPSLIDRARPAGTATEERSGREQRRRRIVFLWFFDPQRRSGAIGDRANPVMVKEFRTRVLGRAHWMMRLIGACLIISLALMLAAANWAAAQPDKLGFLGGVIVIFQMALVILVTPALSSSLVSIELESGGWPLLQSTPLSPLSIVVGKLLSVAWPVMLLLLATVPGYAVLLLIDAPHFAGRVIGVLVSLALTALFSLLLGAACSSLSRRTAPASALAYLVLVALCAGTLVAWLGEGTLFSPALVEHVLVVNPLAAALATMEMPGFEDDHITTTNWCVLGAGSAGLALLLWVRVRQLSRPQ